MTTHLLMLLLLAAIPFICKASDEYVSAEQVKQFQKDGNTFIVAFATQQCPHCVRFGEKIATIEQALKEKNIDGRVYKLDVNEGENREFVGQHDVRGVPTIYLYMGEDTPVKYSGEREAQPIADFVEKMVALDIPLMDSAAALTEMSGETVVISVMEQADGEDKEYLVKLAKKNIDSKIMYTSPSVAKELGIVGRLVVIRADNGGSLSLSQEEFEEKGIDQLSMWIYMASLPAVVPFPSMTTELFAAHPETIAFVFSSNTDDVHWLAAQAEKWRGQIVVALVDPADESAKHVVEFFNVEKDALPTARIFNVAKKSVYIRADGNNDALTAETLSAFVDEYLAGKLAPHRKSEPVPEDWNAQPVKILVGENFQQVAMDTNKFVLVKFYAPWCGHCKRMVPDYESLAENLADRNDVVVSKLDMTANEVEDGFSAVEGFPTIRLYTLSNKMVEYKGDRDTSSMEKWLRDEIQKEVVVEKDRAADIAGDKATEHVEL